MLAAIIFIVVLSLFVEWDMHPVRNLYIHIKHIQPCTDCRDWYGGYSCKECGKPLCGVCADWPSPRLYSPGKGMCTACREKPRVHTPPTGRLSGTIQLSISPFTGEPYDPAWGTIIRHGLNTLEDAELLERGLPWTHEVDGVIVTCNCGECSRAALLRGQLASSTGVKDVSHHEWMESYWHVEHKN